ncbi:hypothetical protein AVW11_03900 [Streptomyces amritsarensis]|uniref:Uncharacterized protein n=1 Tax=Streptomyces amritsarensis TaxID=681158 RepID=A0ABX3G8S3_9ACTN|nr:hypothetical protein AVW11_03900 [Streptomyces amritsarensis]
MAVNQAVISAGPRLAPVFVQGQRILIECPAWCTVDHIASDEISLADVWHGSDYANLSAPRMGMDPELVLFARLGIDSYSSKPELRDSFVVIGDGAEGYYMAPDQADQFAANLVAFAAQIQAMADTARGVA